jgi:hypothetical protein
MRLKTTVKKTDFDDRDLNKRINSIDLDQMLLALTALITLIYIELFISQFIKDSDYTFE